MKESKFINSVEKLVEIWETMDDITRFRLLNKIENNPRYPKFDIKVQNNELYVLVGDSVILNFDGNTEDKREILIINLIKAIGIQKINTKEKKK